jgi:hypothetical protein
MMDAGLIAAQTNPGRKQTESQAGKGAGSFLVSLATGDFAPPLTVKGGPSQKGFSLKNTWATQPA